MSNGVKSSADWMSLFTGSRYSGRESSRYTTDSPGRYDTASSRYTDSSSSYDRSRYSRYTSRYSREEETSPSYPRVTSPTPSYPRVTSPTQDRSSTVSSYTSRYPQYLSRWTQRDEERDERRDNREGGRGENRETGGRSGEVDDVEGRVGGRRVKSAVVLNEGTIVIRRAGNVVNTSDEESDEDSEEEKVNEEEKIEEEEPEPERDPLDVEEEMLQEKLQTAGFLLSMPEEEQIKKRLLEIKQMRENPEMFRPENTKNYKFTQVATEVGKPSTAKEEEEKILLLRLSFRGLSDVEQTDLQVRLQEIWRDRREELSVGLGRVEQHYEHLLSESSTEISELESSINLKYTAITKLQEEMMILHMRKDRFTKDIEQVTSAHQTKLEELRAELSEIDKKSSAHCVVRSNGQREEESSLPEDERSEVEAELECPVCLELSQPPIYQCPEGHIVCSACKPLLKTCPQCDTKYTDPPIRCRFAEKLAQKYFKKDEEDK